MLWLHDNLISIFMTIELSFSCFTNHKANANLIIGNNYEVKGIQMHWIRIEQKNSICWQRQCFLKWHLFLEKNVGYHLLYLIGWVSIFHLNALRGIIWMLAWVLHLPRSDKSPEGGGLRNFYPASCDQRYGVFNSYELKFWNFLEII